MKIYNTLSRKKEEFIPMENKHVKIYACGPTVYNYFHIGNARPFIIFDTLRRYLEYRGNKVTFVQNFTDVDDKMINRAAAENTTVEELGKRFIDEYFKDARALNIKPATHHPKATEHISEIIAMIQKLLDKGYAYITPAKDVYYDVSAFNGYGKLSGQSLDELESGVRVDISEGKKNPADFALWKAKKEGEIFWESPFGPGRPGWHIECSAMSSKYLGETFDIHGGGADLIFPHHENEIAQSEAASGKPFAKYWMHNGFINIDNRKMAKSANNFFTVRDISKEYDLLAVRMFMLGAHYRNPVNFSKDLIEQAFSSLLRINNCIENLRFIVSNGDEFSAVDEITPIQPLLNEMISTHTRKFIQMMEDDLNTAGAIGTIFELVKDINLYFETNNFKYNAAFALDTLSSFLDVLGLIKNEDEEVPAEVLELCEKRQTARKNKDWALSDKLRNEITNLNYSVKDMPDGYKLTKIL